ncbi:MAG: 5-formyltetrahydrofolate cyclo-ligase [Eubacteriales bacterium]|nr:5-formyltetrahydrofolate cyclo-ligase [Eubacteriales bacterium]
MDRQKIHDEKKQLRKTLIQTRSSIPEVLRESKSHKIVDQILASEAYKKAEIIFCFYPIGDELRVDYLFDQALVDNKRIAFPVCLSRGHMESFIPQDMHDMEKDSFGIPSPDPEQDQKIEPYDLDLVIVPLLGFDRRRYRIGYGAGFYDRYLPRVSDQANIIGVAFSEQEVPKIPHDQYDFVLPAILTDKELLKG